MGNRKNTAIKLHVIIVVSVYNILSDYVFLFANFVNRLDKVRTAVCSERRILRQGR